MFVFYAAYACVMTDTSTATTANQERTENVSKATLMISLETASAMKADSALSSGRESPFSSVGRLKAPPTCDDPIFRAEAMSSEELSKFVFAPPRSEAAARVVTASECNVTPTVSISCCSCSSASSRESQSADEIMICKDKECNDMNARVLTRETSRQGRETQRWVTDENTQQVIRLVTGCVPILSNGKILFVSASRKSEWILPKGGWEKDETMEESAIRETYEEAGVVGFLGPRLTEVCYETRKSKKRRLDMEELKKEKAEFSPHEAESSSEKISFPHSTISHCHSVTPTEASPLQERGEKSESHVSFLGTEPIIMSDAAVARIRGSAAKKTSDETSSIASIASDTSVYSHVRMTLFPLYVSEVLESWPESGRIRKAVDIDEAIKMLETRSEFHTFLLEVKAKGLHLVEHVS